MIMKEQENPPFMVSVMTSENFGIVTTFYITRFLLKNMEINIENHMSKLIFCVS